MSVFNASSLRKLGTTPFTTFARQKTSNVSLGKYGYTGLLNNRPVQFSEFVRSPASGVRAPPDTIELTDEATATAKGVTKGIRIAVNENIERQSVLNKAMGRMRRYNPTPVIKLNNSSSSDISARVFAPAQSFTSAHDSIAPIPLNGTLGLSIGAEFERTSISAFGFQVAQAYNAFETSQTSLGVDASI